jgi:hypothetical protein
VPDGHRRRTGVAGGRPLRRRRPGRGGAGRRRWLSAVPVAGGLVVPRACVATVERAALQPFALPVEHALQRLPAVRAAILGLVAARLRRWIETARPVAHGMVGKNFCCVTTRRCNLGIFRGLWSRGGAAAARLLGLGVLGFNGFVLAPPGLSLGRLPAPHQEQALGVLAVALVPALWGVHAATALAKAESRSRSPTATAVRLMMRAAHGRVVLPRDSPGWNASTFRLGRLIQTGDAGGPASLSFRTPTKQGRKRPEQGAPNETK